MLDRKPAFSVMGGDEKEKGAVTGISLCILPDCDETCRDRGLDRCEGPFLPHFRAVRGPDLRRRALTQAHCIATCHTRVLGCGRKIMFNRLVRLLVVTLALSTPAKADGLFGAIAFSPSTGKVGAGWNFSSKQDASADSVARCGVGDCSAVVVFPNCGAVAVGEGFGMGFSADQSVAKAEETALANCSGYTANCLIVQSFCNEGS